MDPLREASHRSLMRAYAEQGEHGLALKQFELCRTVLRDEFAAPVAPETQALADLLSAGGAARTETQPRITASTVANRPSIAVLPLANLRGDPTQQYLCDGLADDIITELARYRSLLVLGSFSSFSARDLVSDAASAFERLRTQYLVTGTYRLVGEEVRIGVQLLASGSGHAVWTDRFTGAAKDLAAFEEEVVRKIVAHIESHVALHEHAASMAPARTSEWLAYDFVLRGRHAALRYDLDAAEGYLRQALAIDPQSATAHAWLAMLMIARTWTGGSAELQHVARSHASLALQADPGNAMAHAAMGYVRQYTGELEAAGPYWERAVALNPNDTRIVTYAGMWWTFMGEPGKGLALMDRGLDREPYPNSGFWGMRANALYQLGDYRGAMSSIDRMTTLSSWDEPYAVASLARIGDAESSRRLRTTYRPKLLHEFGALARHAANEPYRLPEHSEHLREGLQLALELAQA
jgi:TolB-like protein/Tfp pilus assembly protein PilF